jgi:hypothetical protein
MAGVRRPHAGGAASAKPCPSPTFAPSFGLPNAFIICYWGGAHESANLNQISRFSALLAKLLISNRILAGLHPSPGRLSPFRTCKSAEFQIHCNAGSKFTFADTDGGPVVDRGTALVAVEPSEEISAALQRD